MESDAQASLVISKRLEFSATRKPFQQSVWTKGVQAVESLAFKIVGILVGIKIFSANFIVLYQLDN